MSCLGERLTALVDGELGHEERDHALAHLAGCAPCRAEADGLRRVKGRLRGLSEAPPPDGAGEELPTPDFLTRLRSLGESADAGETTQPTRPVRSANRPARPVPPSRPRDNRPAARAASPVRAAAPGTAGTAGSSPPRRRYLAVGAATLFIGLSTASYVAGGRQEAPSVTPAFDRFAVEHALTSGDAPLTDPLTDPAAQTPVLTPPEP